MAKRVERDALITVSLENGDNIVGHFEGIHGSSLLLKAVGEPDSIRAVDSRSLDAIEFRDHSRPVILYVVGGFFAGTIIGVLIERSGEAALLGAAAGTFLGLTFPAGVPYMRRVDCE